MIVGLDLDETLYPFTAAYRQYVLNHHDKRPSLLGPVTTYNFFHNWAITEERFLADLTNGAEKIYGYPPATHACRTVTELASRGHQIFIVTSRPDAARGLTFKWVQKWFGDDVAAVVVSHDKTVIKTDVFLDDAPHVIDSLRTNGQRAIIMDRPWNQDLIGERAYTLEGFADMVEMVFS